MCATARTSGEAPGIRPSRNGPMTTDRPTVAAVIAVSSRDPVLTSSVAGRPVIEWTIRRWGATSGVDRLVLAVDGRIKPRASVPIAMERDRISAIRGAMTLAGTAATFLLCPPDRPLGPGSIVEALRARLEPGIDAVGAARPVRSTLKRVVDGRVVATVSRDEWRSDPDPWLFDRDALLRALEAAAATGAEIVDGRSLVLAGDLRVRLIDADATDLPIRTPADARFAERWLASEDGTTNGSTG